MLNITIDHLRIDFGGYYDPEASTCNTPLARVGSALQELELILLPPEEGADPASGAFRCFLAIIHSDSA